MNSSVCASKGIDSLWEILDESSSQIAVHSQPVLVGHLDTGIDGTHPVLSGHIKRFRRFADRGKDDADKNANDSGIHGTQTAGLILEGARLILGGNQVQLCSARVLEAEDAPARILMGFDWVRSQGVRVVNAALGLTGLNPVFGPMMAALRRDGILPVVPIGNQGPGTSNSPGNYTSVLSIGACEANGGVASFSGSLNISGETTCLKPDLVAPGVNLETAGPKGSIREASGTSMAAGLVSGIAAALFQQFPDASSSDVEEALLETANPLHPGDHHLCRVGRVNPEAALEYLKSNLTGVESEHLETAGYTGSGRHVPRIDPLLDSRLTSLQGHEEMGMIFVVRKERDQAAAMQQAVSSASAQTGDAPTGIQLLVYARTGLVYGSRRFMKTLCNHPSVELAGTPDIGTVWDRMFL